MTRTRPRSLSIAVARLVLFASGAASAIAAPTPLRGDESPVAEETTALSGADRAGLRAAWEDARHAVVAADGGFVARSPGQRWTTRFDGRGSTTTPDSGSWSWGLELARFGREGLDRSVVAPLGARAEAARVTYHWGAGIDEWYVNDRRGLEHGFTVRVRPAGEGPLTVTLAVRGGLRPVTDAMGRGARFVDGAGNAVVTYSGLRVFDALGRDLPARIDGSTGEILCTADDAGAVYPVTIDPIAQQAYLKASNSESGDSFGRVVAISGNTAVVGVPDEDSSATGVNGNQTSNGATDAGAVYVFVRSGGAWSQQAYLKASNTQSGDRFGGAVAISGDTIVAGALGEDSNATGVDGNQANNGAFQSGAAYVFVRIAGVWSQQANLKASNTFEGDGFGEAVAISGDTVVVTALHEDSNATGVNGNQANNSATSAGAAYVFVRSGEPGASRHT